MQSINNDIDLDLDLDLDFAVCHNDYNSYEY